MTSLPGRVVCPPTTHLTLIRTLNMKFVPSASYRLLACAAALALSWTARADTVKPAAAPASAVIQKPVWLTDISFGLKEGYDNNLFLVSDQGDPERTSWVTTLSPKIGVNLAPLFPGEKALQVLTFSYAADVVSYHSDSTENYTAHRLTNALNIKTRAYTLTVDNAFIFVDGSKDAPIYSTTTHDDQRSAFATSAPRERRNQIQDRAKIALQYGVGRGFIRPTASLLYYDLMTFLKTTAGYQNYADRYDLNGGLDYGFPIMPNTVVTVGYRYGHQYQQQFGPVFDKTHTSASSDYQRVLVGLEGKPLKWLTVSVLAGPDFRTYPGNSASHTTPLADLHPVKFYGEAALTAVVSPNDAITFKTKNWQWVSSTGKVPLYDSSFDLGYRRKLDKRWSLDLSAREASLDYQCGNGTSALRYDRMYTASAGLTYSLSSNFGLSAAYTADLGRNAADVLAAGQVQAYREFDHAVVSLAAVLKF